ncbi:DsbA family protein [Flavimaricola marinus]|uniref:Disulfide bond formation protein D n=1 Tax=Flavimaricola marinus TaxID=1819565 RepID=A0A238LFW8_9RHOB|nr:DsbA family protein [Flavimaricola marinus]SMY08314.1 Disulfide bond formation protein D precursor [Flavimaricola marinus]
MNKFLPVAALAVAATLGGTWFLTQPTPAGEPLLGAAFAQDAGEIDTSSIVDMVQGEADAPVEIIEYASYTCPHCAAFHGNQYPQLKADYIDTGKVRFVYREVYFDRFGLWASMMARCGGEMRFFGISEILYAQQQEWIAGGQDPAAIAENLRRIGLTAGIDAEQLDACMSDATTAQTLVAWFEENAERDNVTSTPTLYIDGTKYSNMSYADLSELIEERLAAQ